MAAEDSANSLLNIEAAWHNKPRRVDIRGFCPHCGSEVMAHAEAVRKEPKTKDAEADPRQLIIPGVESEET